MVCGGKRVEKILFTYVLKSTKTFIKYDNYVFVQCSIL